MNIDIQDAGGRQEERDVQAPEGEDAGTPGEPGDELAGEDIEIGGGGVGI
jgi:hypothetical protein